MEAAAECIPTKRREALTVKEKWGNIKKNTYLIKETQCQLAEVLKIQIALAYSQKNN